MDREQLEQQLSKLHKTLQMKSMAIGARAAAVAIREKLQPIKNKKITKQELLTVLKDVDGFCEKFYNTSAEAISGMERGDDG